MKKHLILCALLFLYFYPARCQESQQLNKSVIIRIDSLFKCYGVIIDSSINVPIEIKSFKERFTPSIDQIINSETIFWQSYNETNRTTPARSNAKYIDDVKAEFNNYNRQYVGFIDISGHANIIINLFDYSKKRVVIREIGDSWKRNFVIMFSENPPFAVMTYRVNLEIKKLYATF